jgi:poly(A) polymerase
MEAQAIEVVKALQDAGFQAVFAGGCVRDKLIGRQPKDYDIATNALPNQVLALFPVSKIIGEHFAVVLVENRGFSFEVATFRRDGFYHDGRHPESVEFASMAEDALRRDFTINAIFYDPIQHVYHDFVGGINDLQNKNIIFVGDPEYRIREDKLRMLRAIRLSLQLGFEILQYDLIAIRQAARDINDISHERIRDEIILMLRTRQFAQFFTVMRWTGLMKVILPEIDKLKGVEQPKEFHPEGDVWQHTIEVLNNTPIDASDEMLLAALLHDIGKPETFVITDRIRFNEHDQVGAKIARDILVRLKFANDTIDHVTSIVANHMRFRNVRQMRTAKLKRFMRLDKFEQHMQLHRADCLGSHQQLDNYDFVVSIFNSSDKMEISSKRDIQMSNRILSGDDLKLLGLQPGPIFKEILEVVEDHQLEGVLVTKQQAIEFVQQNYCIIRS